MRLKPSFHQWRSLNWDFNWLVSDHWNTIITFSSITTTRRYYSFNWPKDKQIATIF